MSKVASLMATPKSAITDLGTWAVVFKDLIGGVYRAEGAGAA
ncbi:hypothetical protein ACFXK0_01325 [Nocardia sp. NPDC059177]